MAKEELKSMLYNNPNAFWRYFRTEGMTDDIRSVLIDANNEMQGFDVEESIAEQLQEF